MRARDALTIASFGQSLRWFSDLVVPPLTVIPAKAGTHVEVR